MSRRFAASWLLTIIVLATAAVAITSAMAAPDGLPAAQAPTPFPTPTPNAAGEIIYEVKEGDTAWRVAAIAGISLEELYALNGLESTDFITPGMRLVLGTGGPSLPTADPASEPTVTALEPTPTPEQGTGEICALLFEDVNGNARLEEDEAALAGGQVSVVDANGQLVGEGATESQAAGTELIGPVPLDALQEVVRHYLLQAAAQYDAQQVTGGADAA